MKKALHFGAGNIGRGFIGKLLSEAGYEVFFVDINEAIINGLEEKKEYTVEVVGESSKKDIIKNVRGLFSNDLENLKKIGNEVDVITTAIGPNVLPIIAKSIAKILEYRMEQNNKKPLNIIACENMIKGSTFLKEKVYECLTEFGKVFTDKNIAFVDSAVDRIVPPTSGEIKDATYVVVEEFFEWIVDKNQIKGELEINGMTKVENLMAYLERKLFTLNTGHAITAYLGKAKGIKTIDQSILDSEIRAIVEGAMKESGEVLIKRYNFDRDVHYKYIEKILKRFENKYLNDDVERVGRQPIRKLGKNERLVKPLLGTVEYATSNDNLINGIVAALKFDGSDDETVKLQALLKEKDVKDVLNEISEGVIPQDLMEKIVKKYNK